ncbi:uncharacterized protein BXZ73DRAFT_98892 [Epithele typhae]|uniref:uncharacterized protein n=1 Tax=Epithele typhae TaxID=378194 RepID=UPI002008D153|nr:uncharacterized protein BXZ73DRAFT_98892 [Epithele typhae]KAH9940462.1 hypothetical protein BXZ73DRAFT_98892 [Epithele typhae]
MANIEFVIEAPQVSRNNKKRPRLVTSCDHCRVKKIKCVQQPATGKCEACLSANVPCLYRDRENYFAERTRMLSGAGSILRDASSGSLSKGHLSAINASTSSPSRGSTPPSAQPSSDHSPASSDRSDSPAMFSSYMGVSTSHMSSFQTFPDVSDMRSGPSSRDGPVAPLDWTPPCQIPEMHTGQSNVFAGFPASNLLPPSNMLEFGLFDHIDGTQPHPTLMISFIQDFCDKLSSSYPFLSSESVVDRFCHHRLPAVLANAIAASAARLSTVPEILQIGSANTADVYCQMAKSLIPPDGPPSTLDTLHALMLLAWVEYRRHHQAQFRGYTRSCIRVAAELGFSEETVPQISRFSNSHTARILQLTWEGIQTLERAALAAELVAFSKSSPQPQQTPGPQPSFEALSNFMSESPSLW